MLEYQFPEAIQQWGNLILVWVGFGTLTGLLAKAIMPGRDPGGAVATLLMGIGGGVIGCGILAYFVESARVSPISPIGFIVAVGGAFILLFFYRILGGYWFVEGEEPQSHFRHQHRRRRGGRSRRRRYDSALLDD